MEFGMPTLIEHQTLSQGVQVCQELGLDFIELNQNLPDFQTPYLEAALRSLPEGLYATLHLDENLNPLDFNGDVARAWQDTAVSAVRIAGANGVPVVNMHLPQGVYFTLPDGKHYLFDRYWEEVRSRLLFFRDAVSQAADGVTVCVENTEVGLFKHLEEALELLLQSPRFSLTYDCGHDFTDGMRAKPFYDAHHMRVTHLHLHDAVRSSCHLPLGSGEIPYAELIGASRAKRAVIEVKTAEGLRASVEELRRKGILHG